MWTRSNGWRRLSEILEIEGASRARFNLTSATDLSADGLAVIGQAVSEVDGKATAYYAKVGLSPCSVPIE
jgi:hypothetical protein